MPGPPPKAADLRKRRNAAPATIKLPREGRQGPAPRWPGPLPGSDDSSQTRRARAELRRRWTELWNTPQAAEWERLGAATTRIVSRYLQLLLALEAEGFDGRMAAETRQLEDRLGLTPMSMLRLRYEVVDQAEVAPISQQSTAGEDRRRTMRVV